MSAAAAPTSTSVGTATTAVNLPSGNPLFVLDGVAAILAGVLTVAGQAAELAFGNALTPLWVALFVLRFVAFAIALWDLGAFLGTRTGRIGWRVCIAGAGLLGLFAVQAIITVAITGDIPENFVLFGLGFLLLFVGHVLLATGLRAVLGRAWVLRLVGAAGILVAIALDIDPVHDVGLFVFESAWVALGVALMQTGAGVRPQDGAPAPV